MAAFKEKDNSSSSINLSANLSAILGSIFGAIGAIIIVVKFILIIRKNRREKNKTHVNVELKTQFEVSGNQILIDNAAQIYTENQSETLNKFLASGNNSPEIISDWNEF